MRAYLRERVGIIAAMLVFAALTFGLQAQHTGFWNSHHGWTSVHGLALMTHATPDTGFVAYTQAYMEADGVRYIYFDRYPVGFTVLGNLLLRITDDLPREVYLMRQFMNAVYLAVLFMAYRLTRLTIKNRYLALAAVVLAGGSFHMLYYKDMIHYDTPTIFGLFLVAYTIGRYQLGRVRLRGLAITILVTMCFGRGYVVGFVLAPWLGWEMLRRLTIAGEPFGARLRSLWRIPALWLLAMSIAFGAAWLAYNTSQEARTRDIPITETSIVHSMLRRLPFTEPAEPVGRERERVDYEKSLTGWGQYLTNQTERVALWAVPLKLAGDMTWRFYPLTDDLEVIPWRLGLGLLLFPLAGVAVWRAPERTRVALALAAGSGLLWMYPIISLSTEHIYVAMYALGLVLLAYIALLRPLDGRRWVAWGVLVLALAAYTGTSLQVRAHINDEMTTASQFTSDFSRIRASITEPGQVTRFSPDFPRGTCLIQYDLCYAPGYYLGHNHYIALEQDVPADYLLSPHDYDIAPLFVDPGASLDLRTPLHPENQQVYYYDLAATPEPRTAPDREPLAVFGEELALGAWSLVGEQTVPACGSVKIESWWQAEQQPASNYNMQIVMVGDDGTGITEANRPLGTQPTSIWEEGRYMLDVRTLTVPCDTAPGSYPLIVGLYNPDDLQPRPATATDGTPLGNQFYLTNIVVP